MPDIILVRYPLVDEFLSSLETRGQKDSESFMNLLRTMLVMLR